MTEQEKSEFRDTIVEAVNGVIDKRMQEVTVRIEQFESNVIGLLSDIKSGIVETQKIGEKVDVNE